VPRADNSRFLIWVKAPKPVSQDYAT